MLLYSGEHFVQEIEGNEKNVQQLFAKILIDRHHTNIIKLADGPISQRLFCDWTMGFKTVAAEALLSFRGYVDPTQPESWSPFPNGTKSLQWRYCGSLSSTT
ncbi:BLUF domain-containing protein [Rufibacter immobilis]|uniref:BLUF domain-containing protein n=1 Tax=Rufibacter immobilis TaxID=1348778 RepID=A0A3M9MRK8_9BACT|nr:BLUF domain-containing protein [Rufibacter immobilis]RNI28174.1 BLUF domain-containing protein [Rufibacter immobilis]